MIPSRVIRFYTMVNFEGFRFIYFLKITLKHFHMLGKINPIKAWHYCYGH